MKNYLYDGIRITWYNGTGSAVSSGDVVDVGGRAGVAVVDIAAAASGAVQMTGVVSLTALAGAKIEHGQNVYYNAVTGKCSPFKLGNLFVGKAVPGNTTASLAKTQTGAVVAVRLCEEESDGRRTIVDEDFCKAAISENWLVDDTSAGGAPVGAITSAHGGQFEITLAADSEVENVCLHHNDVLTASLDNGLIFEALLNVATIPDTASSIITLGMGSARNDTPGSVAEHLFFALSANGNLLFQSDDGTTDISDADTDVDVVNGDDLVLVIDARDTGDVRVFVNGVDVTATALAAATGPPTAFDVSAAGTGLLQPIFQVQKAANTKQPSAKLDRIRITASS